VVLTINCCEKMKRKRRLIQRMRSDGHEIETETGELEVAVIRRGGQVGKREESETEQTNTEGDSSDIKSGRSHSPS
jgi:hypothetical protein